MRNGWLVRWKTYVQKDGVKIPHNKSRVMESRSDADKFASELKAKGYSNIKILECIY